MKDSKKYATKIKKLFKELKKKHSPGKEPDYKDPIESVVYAVGSEYVSLSAAKKPTFPAPPELCRHLHILSPLSFITSWPMPMISYHLHR